MKVKQVKDRETACSHAQAEVNKTDLREERCEVVITTAVAEESGQHENSNKIKQHLHRRTNSSRFVQQ